MDSTTPGRRERTLFRRLQLTLHALYHGGSQTSVRFRYGVLVVDLALIAFFIAAPLLRGRPGFLIVDYALALVLGLDIAARAIAWCDFRQWIRRPIVWLDLFVLATLLFPQTLFNFGFLRVLRLWTLINSDFFWRTIGRRYDDTRVEDTTRAIAALVTFVFVVTGFVYTSFAMRYEGISGYVDALYFTVTSLTTTGYGDVTLPGVWGRILSIVTMLVGVTLFLRLAQALFRPPKVRFPCPTCGLMRHDPDAVYCKACGTLLNIPNED
ncbi:potassium channel family protein [Caulobacter sp. 17J80-11]|uniref:potassium channel family protein n=1 Tax=Caulobacter sp. 17J80-11 TaxID=2763502 RepID=UPI001653D645|nr:potassium channel family protein [Caulobacter sp. 17J80-11]MBC6983177.1 ion transporter [Caulobacter sp. 17J80-11]